MCVKLVCKACSSTPYIHRVLYHSIRHLYKVVKLVKETIVHLKNVFKNKHCIQLAFVFSSIFICSSGGLELPVMLSDSSQIACFQQSGWFLSGLVSETEHRYQEHLVWRRAKPLNPQFMGDLFTIWGSLWLLSRLQWCTGACFEERSWVITATVPRERVDQQTVLSHTHTHALRETQRAPSVLIQALRPWAGEKKNSKALLVNLCDSQDPPWLTRIQWLLKIGLRYCAVVQVVLKWSCLKL